MLKRCALNYRSFARFSLLGLSIGLLLASTAGAAETKKLTAAPAVQWQTNYDTAYRLARKEKKLLFLYFPEATEKPADTQAAADPVEGAVADPAVKSHLREYVFARLPLSATGSEGDKPTKLIDHGAFSELRGGPGIAIIDLTDPDAAYNGMVVSVCPMTPGKYYHFQPEHVAVLFDLPSGTLTQRTMVFAVRIHPEAPASTRGEASDLLRQEAQDHSAYQAQIGVQGHQQWEGRAHRIMSRLRERSHSVAPIEVVAESWPNQNLVDSCVDCVDSWRHSSGHWAAVRGEHDCYGYDIQLGGNGIWYATGIFSN